MKVKFGELGRTVGKIVGSGEYVEFSSVLKRELVFHT